MRKTLLILIAMLLTGPAFAEVFYEDAEEMLVERVADNKTLIPCPTPVPFTTFRYPHLNAFMDVTVIADDNSYYVDYLNQEDMKGAKPGIYRSYARSGEIVALVSSDDLVPGTKEPMEIFMGLQTYEDSFVFNGYTKGIGNEGLYASFNGEPFIMLARRGSLNRNGKRLVNAKWGAIYENWVLYRSSLHEEDKPSGSELSLYDHTTKKTVTIVDKNTPIPGHPDTTFNRINSQNWIYEDSVVFRASSHRYDQKTNEKLHGIYLIEAIDPEDPSTFTPDKIIRVVDSKTIMPMSNGKTIDYFYSAPMDSGRIAFTGFSDNRSPSGVYTVTLRGVYTWKDGDLMAIADTDTFIPGKEVKFIGFDKWVSCDKGKVIFRGQGPEGFEGLFLFDPAQETLFTFNDNTELIDGKKVKEFQIGSNCLIGNRVVFTVFFEDKSMGIYLAALPKVIARFKDSRLDPIITHPLAD